MTKIDSAANSSEKGREYIFLSFIDEKLIIDENGKLAHVDGNKNIHTIIFFELARIYGGDYRHEYSEISKYIYEEKKSDDQISAYLIDKCKAIISEFSENEEATIYLLKLRKMNDHIKLEYLRLKDIEEKFSEELKHSQDMNNKLNKKVAEVSSKYVGLEEKANKISDDMENRIRGQETQSITIMGIFAGVIMAFSGGFSLLTSAFEQISHANFYKLIVLTSLIAVAISSILFGLFFIISKMTKKPISTACRRVDNVCGYCVEKCNWVQRVWRKYSYIVVMNGVFAVIATLTSALYYFFKFKN